MRYQSIKVPYSFPLLNHSKNETMKAKREVGVIYLRKKTFRTLFFASYCWTYMQP